MCNLALAWCNGIIPAWNQYLAFGGLHWFGAAGKCCVIMLNSIGVQWRAISIVQ